MGTQRKQHDSRMSDRPWNEDAILICAKRLAECALEVWPFPALSADVVASYKPVKKVVPAMKSMTFRAACSMAGIIPDAELVAREDNRTVVATVTDDYDIRLSNRDILNSPSRAATRVKELITVRCVEVLTCGGGVAACPSMACARSALRGGRES